MHPNPAFRKASLDQNLDFARTRAFGTLAISHDDGPLLAHIPFLLSADGTSLEAHLVRSNPILRALDTGRAAVLCVQGSDSYVSPDWYGADNQVPTWNYVAVHLRGQLRRLPDAELPGILARLSHEFESRLAPKPVWEMTKLEPEVLQKMLRQIVPVAMTVTGVDGTWKLAQNKPDPARLRAAEAISEAGVGADVSDLTRLMRKPPC
jgi:transcriptional regulator